MLSDTWMKVYIQCDWHDAMTTEGSCCWLTVYRQSQKREAKLKKSEDGQIDIEFESDLDPFPDEVKLKPSLIGRRTLTISVENHPLIVCEAPVKEFSHLHGGRKIDCLAVTDSLGASASSSGVDDHAILLWNVETGEVRRKLVGHPFDLSCVSFFPSGLVLLSASLDLRVWSCETGHCPRTMTAHTRPIQDMAIIGKGRNVASVSLDGKLNLFSCASGSVIKHKDFQVGIVCMDIVTIRSTTVLEHLRALVSVAVGGDNEFETDDKLLALATTSGKILLIHAASNYQICSFDVTRETEEITACKFSSQQCVVCGLSSGALYLVQFDSTFSDFSKSSLNLSRGSPVCSIELVDDFLYVSFKDGSVSGVNFVNAIDSDVSKEGIIVRELTGSDCDAIYNVCCNSKHIFTSCRDGKVRIYNRDCRI